MAILSKSKQMKKELSLLDVYAIATGTTLSAGFFLLPGLAVVEAGPAVILSYLLSALQLVPAMLCMMELATAMPRAGGAYYFLDRSMGPLVGTVGGLGTWLTLVFKSAFALVGIGAYISLFIEGDYVLISASIIALALGYINLFGAKKTGKIQTLLVAIILLFVGGFIFQGLFRLNPSHFNGFFDKGAEAILATTGMVYISFAGLTKVTSISEEVKDPEKNLPLGMMLGFLTSVLFYGLGVTVMVGVLPPEQLHGNLTPVATVAEYMAGNWGKVLVTIAALLAFLSVTNAGILSASRYPLAMSRDHLLPGFLKKVNKHGVPHNGIYLTVFVMLFCIVAMNPAKIAKLGSAFQLVIFALCCLAVIIMRESQIEAYDPGYRVPFYPWIPIAGIILPYFLIIEMGWLPILFSTGLVLAGALWYFYYAKERVTRDGAIYHVFEQLGKQRDIGLEPELRGILKEKGLRSQDPFVELVARARLIDLDDSVGSVGFDDVIKLGAKLLSDETGHPREAIEGEILQGTKIGATPVSHGAALPHLRLQSITHPHLLLMRSVAGVKINLGKNFWGEHMPTEPIHIVFFLISPEEDPGKHLRILAKIAGRVDDHDFMASWLSAETEQELKKTLLGEENYLNITLKQNSPNAHLIGKEIKDIQIPEKALIAIIHHAGEMRIPHGNTLLEEGDILTIIGEPEGIEEVRNLYGER